MTPHSQTPAIASKGAIRICFLQIRGVGHIPSKKNRHYAGVGHHVLMDKSIKRRMLALERAIEFALYFACQTGESGTDSECLKQLRTHLSLLCDDSVREIPSHRWDVEWVAKGEEGADILIERL